LIFTHPRLARFLDRWIDWLAFVFVVLSIWSLLYVATAGLNLWVYDTCDPSNAESCSLSGEACGVDQPSVSILDTLSRIPDRLKTWNTEEYLGPTATYYHQFDPAKPVTLEIIDPSCKFCKKLTGNLHTAGVFDRENVSYLLYPIPKAGTGGYKFPHSFLMASYIEATKSVALTHGDPSVAPDWQLLEKIFSPEQDKDGTDLQTKFAIGFTRADAEQQLRSLLTDIGYTPDEVERISHLAISSDVQNRLAAQRTIVEERVRTIKIPTLLHNGRRYDRVVDVGTLR
jgi:hypothetical protein